MDEELNRHLAAEYGIKADDNAAYAKWLKSHQPFHWFVEFYGIMDSGGFDVIIGNPPYVELSKVLKYRTRNYATIDAGNLYNLCLERCGLLLAQTGFLGVIVPLSGFSTGRMKPYQDFIRERFNTAAISYYSGDAHPSVLFDGVKYRLCIILGLANGFDANRVFASAYLRWYAIERSVLLSGKMDYGECNFTSGFLRFAKVGSSLATQILRKILYKKTTFNSYLRKAGKGHITYHRSPVFWIRSMDFEPYFSSPFKQRSTDHLKDLYLENMSLARRVGAVLNSTVFYFWFTAQGNCRNIAGPDVENFPIGYIDCATLEELDEMLARLMADLKRHSRRRVYNYESGGQVEYDEFYPSRSKSIINEIDHVLARHYGFTEEELDFIINYDIKYRLGGNSETEDE